MILLSHNKPIKDRGLNNRKNKTNASGDRVDLVPSLVIIPAARGMPRYCKVSDISQSELCGVQLTIPTFADVSA